MTCARCADPLHEAAVHRCVICGAFDPNNGTDYHCEDEAAHARIRQGFGKLDDRGRGRDDGLKAAR